MLANIIDLWRMLVRYKLTDKEISIVILHYYACLSISDIAKDYNTTKEKITTLQTKALRKIKYGMRELQAQALS